MLQLRTIQDSFQPHWNWTSMIKNSGGTKFLYWFHCLTRPRKVNYMNCYTGNDDVTILDLLLDHLYVGQYYKTGVKFGQNFTIPATAQKSDREIVLTGESVECGDHDFSSEKLTQYTTLRMNLTETPVESLFSSGKDGNEQICMSVHDETMDCSTGIKHVANLYIIMIYEEEMTTTSLVADGGRPTPYFVLVKCDGGPEQNLSHLKNQIYMFALLLV